MYNKNILNDLFYKLFEDGWIYEEDEDGYGMSYGEYAAIDNYMYYSVGEEIENLDSFEEKIEALREIIKNTNDDARMFVNLDDIEDFLDSLDEEDEEDEDGNITGSVYKLYGNPDVPDIIKDAWNEYLDNVA